ncbi:glycine N-acyltransferase-like protein 3 isoform X2 [Lissotriton helveticus]
MQVYGSLSKIRQGNPFHQEILVDSWPNFNAVLVRPQQKEENSNSDMYMNSYVYYFKDPTSVPGSFIGAIDWSQAFEVQGLQCFLGEVLLNEARLRHTRTEMTTLITFHQDKESCIPIPCPSGGEDVEISPLKPSHAELVDKTWTFGGSDCSLHYVRTCIKTSPSRCCVTRYSERAISWALTDQYEAIRMAYTLPEYRCKGYARCIVSSLADVLRQDGRPVYCHVEDQNEPSQTLFRSLGFTELTGGKLLWFHSKPDTKY